MRPIFKQSGTQEAIVRETMIAARNGDGGSAGISTETIIVRA